MHLHYHVDGPDDDPDDLIKEFFPSARRIPSLPGLGLPHAYFALLDSAPKANFYAFCDQDDVWVSDKLRRASQEIAAYENQPSLWISPVVPFDGEQPPDSVSPKTIRPTQNRLGAALVQTLTPGCSMVWNNALHEELRRALPVSQVMMHDAWVGLVATAIGRVVESREAGVYYRIHEANSVGLEEPIMRRGFNVLNRLSSNGPTFSSQASELLRHFGPELSPSSRELVSAVSEWNRGHLLKLWMQGRIWRRGIAENMLLAMRFLLPE